MKEKRPRELKNREHNVFRNHKSEENIGEFSLSAKEDYFNSPQILQENRRGMTNFKCSVTHALSTVESLCLNTAAHTGKHGQGAAILV